LDGQLVGRVDLKAERIRPNGATALHALGAFAEPGVDRKRVAGAMAGQLQSMASWLGLDDVVVGERGDLVAELRSALR
jgi:uncharacterized protein YcaQ